MDTTSVQPSLNSVSKLVSRLAADAVALVGVVGIAGWFFQIEVLKSGLPGLVSMKPNEALGFLLAGISARILASERSVGAARAVAFLVAAGVASLGFATLLEYVSRADLGIDQLLFREAPGAFGTSHPARMAPNTALVFLALGLACLTIDFETRRGSRPAQALALGAGLVPLQAIVGYAYGVEPLYGYAAFTHMPLHSGFAAALLCASVLTARPDRGFMRVISSAGPGGFMARRLLLAITLLPASLGWLFLVAGLRAGQYEALVGASFVVVSAVVIGGAVVWWNAAALERMDADRSRAEVTLREQREWLRTTLASIADAVVAVDPEGRVVVVNAAAEALTGWKAEDAVGVRVEKVLWIVDAGTRRPLEIPVQRALRESTAIAPLARGALLARGRGEVPVEWSAAPIRDPQGGRAKGVVVVLHDLSERIKVEEERTSLLGREQAARRDAETASRTKDEFIATLSHELRTPLNAVLGWARLLRTGKLDVAATMRAVESIERSASTQAQIVDDILDISRIIRGQLRLDIRSIEIVPVIEAAIDAVRPAAAARTIEIASVLTPRTGSIAGDPGRLQQVVWNLLANAIKFTPPGGRVEVRLERRPDDVQIMVKDTGNGIAPEFLPHVFERFRQADSSTTRAHGGLGLGLAIVRHLVEAHGGTVSAESAGLGRGATFTVTLPIASPRARIAEAEPPRPMPAPQTAAPLAPLDALRVLIVDDDADTLDVVKQVLEEAGAQVTAAASADEALASLQTAPPDVLVSDIGMPGEDGYSLIRRVRCLDPDRGGRVPAAALTAYTQSEDRRQAIVAGYQLYLSKPVEPAELTAAIARLAGRAA